MRRQRLVITGVLVAAVLGFIGYWLYDVYAPNGKMAPFRQYHALLADGRPYALFGGEVIDEPGAVAAKDGAAYLSVDFIRSRIDRYIFWDEQAGAVTITTANRVIRMNAEALTYYVNGSPMTLAFPVVKMYGRAYLPASFIAEFYGYDADWHADGGYLFLDDVSLVKTYGKVTAKKAALRPLADKKSPVLTKLARDTELLVWDVSEDYVYARTDDGVTGFLRKKDFGAERRTVGAGLKPMEKPINPPKIDGRITMMWEQFWNADGAANVETRTMHGDLDVLSPTWFSFNEDYSGDLANIADQSYVDWAHENGAQVWPLITDNFDGEVSAQVLRDADKRDAVIRQLLGFAAIYGFDGINIDFEMVREADAAYYIQFLRELAPFAHLQGLTLSVDMYVPKPHNLYYDRAAVAQAADYLIIMGYDEYWRGRGEAGPVASIGFVEEGIVETLKEAPPEKVILGVPFYNRVWTETRTDEGVKVTAEDCGMTYPLTLFDEAGADVIWNAATGTGYGEYEGEDADGNAFTRKVWLENEEALALKIQLARAHGLAGVAGWKKRLEKDTVWTMLANYKAGTD